MMMTKLDKINVGKLQASVAAIMPVFDKSCRYTASHSQPPETQGIRPTLDELKADHDTVLRARQPQKSSRGGHLHCEVDLIRGDEEWKTSGRYKVSF